jgi:autotransporter-associated beta strand protein
MRVNRTSKFHTVLAASAILAATAQLASADTFLWQAHVDSNWDTATANWDNSTAATTNDTWVNASPSHTAQFDSTAATPGTVTVVPTGASAINVAQIDVLGAGDWTLATGNLTRAGGGTLTTNIAPGDTLNLGAVITNAGAVGATGGTSVSLLVSGGGTLNITAPQTFTGSGSQGVSVTGGSTLKFNSQAAAASQNAFPGNFGNGIYLDNGKIVVADASTGTVGQNRVFLGPGGGTIDGQGSAATFVMGSSGGSVQELTPGTGGNFLKTGPQQIWIASMSMTGSFTVGQGTVQLTAANTYAGGTFVDATTTLSLRNPSGAFLPLNGNVTVNGTLNIVGSASGSGLTQTIGNLTGLAGAIISLPNVDLVVAGTGTTAYGGVISSSTKLSKTNGGNLTLTGLSTRTGITTITGGTITAGVAGTIGTNGALGVGHVTINGGTLTSNVANVNTGGSTNGNFDLSAGVIDPNSTSNVGSFTLNTGRNFVMSGGTLDFNIASAAAFDQIIQRAGANTAAFTITGGTLDLNLGPANSALYNNTYQIFQNFGGANSVANLTITDYDTTDWTASLSNTGLLSFAPADPIPEPASLALLTLGATALLTRRRK